jgi:20S proteasome subunit alpha 5
MDRNCIWPFVLRGVVDFRYHAEPSGTFYRYDAKAIGSGSEGAQAELQQEYFKVCPLCSLVLTV